MLKSSPFENQDDNNKDSDLHNDPFTNDPFADTSTSGFDAIIGNNNISSNPLMYGYHNGIYGQSNDFLMNFYASQCTNYPFTATTNTTPSYNNPFHPHHFINHHVNINDNDMNDINSNNDNWANFNSSPDNFADFDSHFANMAPVGVESMSQMQPLVTEDIHDDTKTAEEPEQQCFVTTTQVIEISSLPPPETTTASIPEFTEVSDERREFQLGPNPTDSESINIKSISAAIEELEDEEFYSLRDDSNEMNSLTDDTDRKLVNENTEIPEDDDDDFASADER